MRTTVRLPDELMRAAKRRAQETGRSLTQLLEDALRAVDGFGGEFRVIVSRREAMDELLVRAEVASSHAEPEAQAALRTEMRTRLRARIGVHPVLELVPEGTLPRTEFKARRVIDDRDLYRARVHDAPR